MKSDNNQNNLAPPFLSLSRFSLSTFSVETENEKEIEVDERDI